jgi:hypothetical protein
MKRKMLGLAYVGLVGTAFVTFVEESIAGDEVWAAVKAKRRAVNVAMLADRACRWRGASFAVCVPAWIVWRLVRTEAAAVCLFLCIALPLLSMVMQAVFR